MNTEWNHPFRANYMDLMQPKRGVYFNIKVELKEKELPLISQYTQDIYYQIGEYMNANTPRNSKNLLQLHNQIQHLNYCLIQLKILQYKTINKLII